MTRVRLQPVSAGFLELNSEQLSVLTDNALPGAMVMVAIGLVATITAAWWARRPRARWGAAAVAIAAAAVASAGVGILVATVTSPRPQWLTALLLTVTVFVILTACCGQISRVAEPVNEPPLAGPVGRPGWVYRDNTENYYLVAQASSEPNGTRLLLLKLPEFAAVEPDQIEFPLVPAGPGEISVEQPTATV